MEPIKYDKNHNAQWVLEPCDGRWLVFLKEAGMTSSKAVLKVKHLLGVRRVGHAGTLDPMATGVLPMALNRATRTVSFAMDTTKVYRVSALFGRSTSTHDKEGETTAVYDTVPSLEKIRESVLLLEQQKTQRPPAYSAIRVRGERACDRMRRGEGITLLKRAISPISVTIKRWEAPRLVFDVRCGKGFYVRSLVRDLGVLCHSGAYVESLERMRVGIFEKKMGLSLEQLSLLVHNGWHDCLEEALFPLDKTLDRLPRVRLCGDDARRLVNGRCVSLSAEEAHAYGARVDFLEELENSCNYQNKGKIFVVYCGDIPVVLSRVYVQRLSANRLGCLVYPKKLLAGERVTCL